MSTKLISSSNNLLAQAVMVIAAFAMTSIGQPQILRAVQRATPIAIARNQNHPSSITVDDANIYWVSDSGSAIKRLSKSGGAPAIIATGQKQILRIVADGDSIYFMTLDQIGKVGKTGGPVSTLARITGYSGGYWTDLATDASNIYFVMSPPRGGEQIAKISKIGSEPVILASGIYYPRGVSSDGEHLYWGSYADGRIGNVSVNGGTISMFGESSVRTVLDLSLDDTNLYCACDVNVLKFSKAGGSPVKLATNKLGFIRLEADQTDLYGITYDQKRLYRVSKNGGSLVLVAAFGTHSVIDFAVDAKNIYWTNRDAGTVMSRRK